MGKRRLNNWRRWLPIFSAGLLIVAPFAPLPETPHSILMLLGLAGMLVYLVADSPASRWETARFLVPLAALVLLALLLSIDPKWVIFGFVGIYAGITLREAFRLEHAEYLAERKRLP